MKRFNRLALLGAVVASVTCREPTAPNPLSRIVVTGPAALHVGDQVTFHATFLSGQGDTLPTKGVQWSSSNDSVGFVDLTGNVSGIAPGQATIRATASGVQGSASVTVTLAPVVFVTVTPRIDSVFTGTTLQLQVLLQDSANRPLTRRVVTWRSSDTTRGVVSDSGLVTARGPGSFTVTATSEGVVNGAFLDAQQQLVSILLPDSFDLQQYHQIQFIPGLVGSGGGQLAGRPLSWTSSDTGVAHVSSAGVITAGHLGVTVISVVSGPISDSCRLRVVVPPIGSVSIAVSAAAVLGHPDTAKVIVLDSAGHLDSGSAPTWASSDTSLLTVTPIGPASTEAVIVGRRVGAGVVSVFVGIRGAQTGIAVSMPLSGARFLQDTLTLPVGGESQFPMSVTDTAGGRYGFGFLIHYASSAPTVAYADTTVDPAEVRGLKAGKTVLTATTDGGARDSAIVIVVPVGTRVLQWNPTTAAAFEYDTAVVQLGWDTTGGGAPPPRAVTFATSDTGIIAPPAGFVLNGTVNFTVHSRRPGTALLTVSTDSTSKTLGLEVFAEPATKLHLTPRVSIARVGDTASLTAVVTDGGGSAHPYPVTFTVSDTSRASFSPAGVVVFKSQGPVVLRAASGNATDSLPIQIQTSAAVRIDSISPAVLRPGGSAVIFGVGFTPATTTVVVGGVSASVGVVTPGTIPVIVPSAQDFPCSGTHQIVVTASASGQLAADSVLLAVADTFSLPVAMAQEDPAGVSECKLVTQRDATYRVSVVNSSTAWDTVELRTAGSTVPILVPPNSVTKDVPGPAPVTQLIDSINRAEQAHLAILATNRRHAARLGSPVPGLTAARASRPAMSPSAIINGIAQIRIPRIDLPDYCSAYTSIQARLVYAGVHVRVFEDVAAPLAHLMDSAFVNLGRQFDSADYPILQANFGNPLLLDTLLDGSGKVTLVFSPVVTSYGTTGIVTDCDFYSETVAPSSNTTEIIYGPVPTSSASGFIAYTPDVWKWEEPSAIMHEAKHLVSYAYHLANAQSFEDLWLEEATATAAQEILARGFYGTAWKGNATYQQTLYCDLRPTTPSCAGHPLGMFDTFAEFWEYAGNHENRTPLGPVASNDATFVGSGWAYLRWAIDQYAGSESAFLTALTQEPVLTGVANLAARTGHSNEEMLSSWFTMWTVAGAGGVGGANQQLTFPSWDLKGIWTGMSTDDPSAFGIPFPTGPRTFAATDSLFVDPAGPIPPGTGAYYQLTNLSNTPLVIRVSGPGGSALPAGVVVQYLRIE